MITEERFKRDLMKWKTIWFIVRLIKYFMTETCLTETLETSALLTDTLETQNISRIRFNENATAHTILTSTGG